MVGRRIKVLMTLLLVCCSATVVSAGPCTPQSEHPLPSVTGAIGFLCGRMSNYAIGHDEFGDDIIKFYAKCVFFLAIADPLMCSLVRLYINKNVNIDLESEPTGYIGNNSFRIWFKTMVPGPI